MKLFWRLILLTILGAGGFFGYQYLNPSEESRIRERMNELAALVSIEAGAGNIRRALMMEQFPQYFTSDCDIKVYVQGANRSLSGRSDMANAARYLAGQQGGMKVEFHDLSIALSEDLKSAQVTLTTTSMMTSTESLSAMEFELEMVNNEGTWLIDGAKSVQSLTR